MKASLQEHSIDYPKTHDLARLLYLFPQEKISKDDETFINILSQFAVESRYGEDVEPPWNGRQMMEKAKKFAELVETLWEDILN